MKLYLSLALFKLYVLFVAFYGSLLLAESFPGFLPKPKSIILVDPFSEYLSGHVTDLCKERDYQVIDVASPYMCAYLASKGRKIPEDLQAPKQGDEVKWAEQFNWTDISAVLSESDSSLTTAERIQVALNLPGNGESPQLRNKYLMNEACKEANLQTVKQCLAKDWNEAQIFIQNLWGESDNLKSSYPKNILSNNELKHKKSVIVKPVRGVASDGVYHCSSLSEAKLAFDLLLGAITYGGGRNKEVLVQEFAYGQVS